MKIVSGARRIVFIALSFKPLNSVLRFVFELIPQNVRPALLRYVPVTAEVAVELPTGGEIKVLADGTDWIATQLHWFGWRGHEPETLLPWLALADGAATIIDVGANIGLFSLSAARINPSARVYAFEPHPRLTETLEHNADLNGFSNVEVVRCAVGLVDSPVILHVPTGIMKPISSSTDAEFRSSVEPIEVEGISLDSFVVQRRITAVDLLKLDTEGTEVEVLRGAKDLLERFAPLIICEALGKTDVELTALLSSSGYLFYLLSGTELHRQEEIKRFDSGYWRNFLCVPRERTQQVETALARLNVFVRPECSTSAQ